MISMSSDQVKCVLGFLDLSFPRSGLASDKAQILFQSCRQGYRAQSVLRERRRGFKECLLVVGSVLPGFSKSYLASS